MGRLQDMFAGHRAAGTGALMPFLTAGYPSQESTAKLIRSVASAGAHALEIGIPFSDPIADGPVISQSMHASLQAGTTPDRVMEVISSIREEVDIPLIAMLSISIVNRRGGASFVHNIVDAGFDGLIIPDADLEDLAAISSAVDERSVAFSTLVAPDSSSQRIAAITSHCREFVYLLTRRGLTGSQAEVPRVEGPVALIRASTELPIAAGFGISTPEHVRGVLADTDGAIVGSALVQVIDEATRNGERTDDAVSRFISSLAEACG